MKLDTSNGAARWASLVGVSLVAAACASEDDGGGMPTAARSASIAAPAGGQGAAQGIGQGTVGSNPMPSAMAGDTVPTGAATPTPAPEVSTTPGGMGGAPAMPSAPAAPVDPTIVEPLAAATGVAPSSFSYCAACHAMGAEGVTGLGPEIRHPPAGYFDHVVRNGRDANPDVALPMSPVAETTTSDADLAEIFAWLSQQPKPTTGQGLYTDYCANCHGADGTGVAGKDVRSLVMEIPTIVRAGSHPGDYGNSTEFMPSWTADELTDAEVQLIVGFVTALAAL
jgi:mono/diheme cytochrome c family protein